VGSFVIRGKKLDIPIIQGGMGVGISLGGLAGAVMAEGGMGTISAANPGFKKPEFFKKPLESNLAAFAEEIAKARKIANGRGMLAVNIMVKGSNYAAMVTQAVKNCVDVIVSGAGLPLELPKFTKGTNVAMAPIVSSAKAAQVICRSWERKHEVYPDFIVVEGAQAGGHLGFSDSELVSESSKDLKTIVTEVLSTIKPFEEKAGRKIPVVAAGGIFTGSDINDVLEAGSSAVQMGTRFIPTFECDASEAYKQAFINAKKEDIVITKSPAGLPGRAIKTSLTKRLETEERIKPKWCVGCLQGCSPKSTVYCISEALINAANGDLAEHALVFTGTNGYKIEKIKSVQETVRQLMSECEDAAGGVVNG